ncbi:MAG TPA: BON domain-containing protein [Ramlibacter sp.]|nr:BON domain-containing protein [Ramlibacter sp.]
MTMPKPTPMNQAGGQMLVVAAFALGALGTWWLDGRIRRFRAPAPPDDNSIKQSVVAQLPLLVAYPQAVDVSVRGGVVRLGGQVLAAERDRLLAALVHLPGVHKVHNALSTQPGGP